MKKRLICMVSAIALTLAMTTSVFAAADLTESNEISVVARMDSLDIMIAAFRVLAATSDEETPFWYTVTDIAGIEPLYNLDREIIAFYLTFEPSGYVIVNNNVANPVIMEFSTSSYAELDALISNKELAIDQDDAYICYGGASNLFTLNDALTYIDKMRASSRSSDEIVLQLYSIYSYMNGINAQEYIEHMSLRSKVEEMSALASMNTQRSTRTSYTLSELKTLYGMIDWENMPTGASYYTVTIEGGANIDYGTTAEFADVNGADNHCAATAAYNLIAYYSVYLDRPELLVDNDPIKTFTAIHQEIGNGPVAFPGYNSGLSRYVASTGRTYHYELGGNYASIKSGIDSNHMSTVLLSSSITSWHMVNAVGYREYSTGTKYIRIVNGWEDTARRFILSTNMIGSYVTWIT